MHGVLLSKVKEKKMRFFFPKKLFNKSKELPRGSGGGCAHTVSHTRVEEDGKEGRQRGISADGTGLLQSTESPEPSE